MSNVNQHNAMQTLEKPTTHDEFRAMTFSSQEEKEYVFELINGEIVAKNHPTTTHQRVLRRLSSLIDTFVSKDKLGEVFFAPLGVVLGENNDVQPDLFVVLDANLPNLREDGFYGAPDLIIEIISPSSIKLDRSTKFKLYERAGVAEYWIVDTKNQSIEVYGRVTGVYDITSFAVETGAVTSSVLPGLIIGVAPVFA